MGETKFLDAKEILNVTLSAIILGFVFSFREWGYGSSFSFTIGLINFIRTSIIAMIVLAIYLLAQKIAALRNDTISQYSIWSIERYWFSIKSAFKKPLKIGVILPLLLVIVSNGIIKFAATGASDLKEIRSRWMGRAFKHITEYQTALIHLAGPITLMFLATLLSPAEELSKLVLISYSVAIFSMLPLSNLDGAKIFFGSVPLYIFSIVLMISAIIIINIASPVITLLLAILLGIIAMLIFLYKHG